MEIVKTYHEKVVEANWYVFGAVILTVGMYLITSHMLWFVLLVPTLWAFGLSTAVVFGSKAAIRKEIEDE